MSWAAILGRRVPVFWPDDRKSYGGAVRAWEPGSDEHLVLCDDGEEHSHLLDSEQAPMEPAKEGSDLDLDSEPSGAGGGLLWDDHGALLGVDSECGRGRDGKHEHSDGIGCIGEPAPVEPSGGPAVEPEMVKQMIDPAPGNVAVVGCAPAQRGTTPGVVGPLDEHGADPGHVADPLSAPAAKPRLGPVGTVDQGDAGGEAVQPLGAGGIVEQDRTEEEAERPVEMGPPGSPIRLTNAVGTPLPSPGRERSLFVGPLSPPVKGDWQEALINMALNVGQRVQQYAAGLVVAAWEALRPSGLVDTLQKERTGEWVPGGGCAIALPPAGSDRATLSLPARALSSHSGQPAGGGGGHGGEGGPPMEACDAPIVENGDDEGEPGKLVGCLVGRLKPRLWRMRLLSWKRARREGGEFAFLSPTALEALLRGSGGGVHMVTRDALGRDLSEVELDAVNRELLQPERVVRQRGAAYLSDGKDAYHRIARGGLVIPCLHAVFDAGLVGESGESMDPIPIIQTMEVEEDTVARGGLGVAEAATALPSEVVRAEYIEAAGGAEDRPRALLGCALPSSAVYLPPRLCIALLGRALTPSAAHCFLRLCIFPLGYAFFSTAVQCPPWLCIAPRGCAVPSAAVHCPPRLCTTPAIPCIAVSEWGAI
ncbi:hypothetical protein CYMTET_29315 [Cymbomonas tetramitiformis]|uniref:Uncharacterized protein n=1 Tax=Cymbomonas tetramitiformis TaxID=36881 RepID=A0AAE0FLP5_9CHLO|nr:hypothetical protein CYMTET_29315 [Cymbomonas tetramitiformis]